MPLVEDIVDHSPYQPSIAELIPSTSKVVLIDNYDSFTFNVEQYLWLEGAKDVVTIRNDQITLDQLISLQPSHLVVSPGPGHPDTDAGISKDAIKYFSGKIPVLGVCMGEQCIYSVFGGRVEVTGEIMHGKTSQLHHDSKGLYRGLPQNFPVTRYHSLAGTHPTLPDCLEVSSWIQNGSAAQNEIIMGVRHKVHATEGVQFHPESILTAEGRPMIRRFLQLKGGTWSGNSATDKTSSVPSNQPNVTRANGTNDVAAKRSILDEIFEDRRIRVSDQKKIPSLRPTDLQQYLDLGLAPTQVSFPDRLRRSPFGLSLMAEIKRASPSKGIISLDSCAPQQAYTYALAGASVISVLTEPKWFKGSIEDLRAVRIKLDQISDRPAVLRKDFVFDEYQILEARLAGADTVLLIVKMLERERLKQLYEYSRSLGMEPLVEVNTVEEMRTAVELGSGVIGVNNRNLANFEVDLDTTSRLLDMVPQGCIICALSGITNSKDVDRYRENGVGAVLVGEALMRAENTSEFISELLGGASGTRSKG